MAENNEWNARGLSRLCQWHETPVRIAAHASKLVGIVAFALSINMGYLISTRLRVDVAEC